MYSTKKNIQFGTVALTGFNVMQFRSQTIDHRLSIQDYKFESVSSYRDFSSDFLKRIYHHLEYSIFKFYNSEFLH